MTTSYSTLMISEKSWLEIANRLKEAGVGYEYINDSKIIFGSVALIKEPINVTWERGNLETLKTLE